MLETDDMLLDNAEETGYRLCRVREALRRPSLAERLASRGADDADDAASVRRDRRGSGISLAGSLGSAVPPTKLKDKIFSVSWDCNCEHVLYVCYQDGRLKVIDNSEDSDLQSAVDDYEVVFRQYLLHAIPESEEELKHEKPVRLHWDKMLTIPGRPRELVFLLGISKSIMYTSLPAKEGSPYPSKPILSSLTRGDIAGFNYGTPILQLAAHSARITALAVSPLGHILASGDEKGELKLALLQSPSEDVTSFQQTEDYIAAAHTTSLHSHKLFASSYNLVSHPHIHKNSSFGGSSGPIFALQWLPLVTASEHNEIFQYALASGAADRAVRIWYVSFSLFHGITLCPLLSLDTLSTNLLSLCVSSASPILDVTQSQRVVLSSWDAIDVDLEDESERGPHSEDDDEDESEFDETVDDVAVVNRKRRSKIDHQEIFLAAGTHLGTVHVWRLQSQEIFSAMEKEGERELREWEEERERPTRDRSRESEKSRSERLRKRESLLEDDGSFLVSILQCSDCPIVHLSSCLSLAYALSACPSSGSLSQNLIPQREVLLAASDVKGRVRIFTTNEAVSDREFEREIAGRMGLESASERLLEAERERDEWAKQDNELLSRIRETYRSALVAVNERERLREQQKERERDREMMSFSFADGEREGEGAEQERLAIRVDEEQEIAADWLLARQRQRALELKRERVIFVSLKDDVFSQPVVSCAFSPSLIRKEEDITSSRHNNDREENVMSRMLLIATMDGKIRVFSMDRNTDSQTKKQESRKELEDINEEPERNTQPLETQIERSSPRRETRGSEGISQKTETFADPLPSPHPKTDRRSVLDTPSSPPRSPVRTGKLQQIFPSDSDSFAEKDITNNNKIDSDEEERPRAALHISSSIRPKSQPDPTRPAPCPVQKKSISVLGSRQVDNEKEIAPSFISSQRSYSKSAPISPFVTKPISVSESIAEPLPASLFVSPTPHPLTVREALKASDVDRIMKEKVGPIPPVPFSFNEYAQPELHSSKGVVDKLMVVSQKIEDDDFTVSTAKTTSSDKRAAVQTLQKQTAVGRRYDQLTSAQHLDAQEVEVLVNKMKTTQNNVRATKQVDREWLNRKKAFALTEQDMDVFKFREPSVDLAVNFAHERDLSTKEKERLRQNQQFGLHSAIDPATLQATFRFEINMDDVFGEETMETQRQRQLDYHLLQEKQSFRRLSSLLSTRHTGSFPNKSILL